MNHHMNIVMPRTITQIYSRVDSISVLPVVARLMCAQKFTNF